MVPLRDERSVVQDRKTVNRKVWDFALLTVGRGATVCGLVLKCRQQRR
jgi:hypothetical protein